LGWPTLDANPGIDLFVAMIIGAIMYVLVGFGVILAARFFD
jgi:hypothetical protein